MFYLYLYIYIYIYTCLYLSTSICLCVYIYACIYVCICIWMCICIFIMYMYMQMQMCEYAYVLITNRHSSGLRCVMCGIDPFADAYCSFSADVTDINLLVHRFIIYLLVMKNGLLWRITILNS